jgi:cytochrome c-type biogenesis protein CcmE
MSVETTWEKQEQTAAGLTGDRNSRLKFLVGGLLILGAVGYLIISGTATSARYFMTVESLMGDTEYVGQTVRISGAVIGDTIVYDDQNLILDFTIAHIPDTFDDLALTLHQAVTDPDAPRLAVHIEGEVKPDLLQHEAQAILTGRLDSDGVFYADELLLKCPSRYEEAAPDQVMASS